MGLYSWQLVAGSREEEVLLHHYKSTITLLASLNKICMFSPDHISRLGQEGGL